MDDLIRRQDAIRVLNAKCKKAFNLTCGEEDCACAEYMALRDLPSAQQWIPCSERMPEEYVSVLCYQPIYEGNNIWIGYLNADGFWVDSDGLEKLTNPATAWMPLP